jgi:hypothetical protein
MNERGKIAQEEKKEELKFDLRYYWQVIVGYVMSQISIAFDRR